VHVCQYGEELRIIDTTVTTLRVSRARTLSCLSRSMTIWVQAYSTRSVAINKGSEVESITILC